MNKKVICFGEILWDNLPTGRLAGGAPMNVAYHLRKLGIESTLISRIGKDDAGRGLIDFSNSIDIPSPYIQIDELQKTSEVTGTLKANYEMVYDIVFPSAWDFISLNNKLISAVAAADMFVYGSLAGRNEVSRNTLLTLLENAKYNVFDVNLRVPHYHRETITELLAKANLIKVNENEIRILGGWFSKFDTEEDQIKSIQDLFDIEEIIITKGADGSFYYSQDKPIFQKSYQVDVADTVGSGDSFLAAFIASKLQNRPIAETLKLAAGLGAFVATKTGACPLYEIPELEAFMKETSINQCKY